MTDLPLYSIIPEMQETEVYSRWRRPESWARPGRVTIANLPKLDPDDPMQAALLAAGVNLTMAPLRDSDGAVNVADFARNSRRESMITRFYQVTRKSSKAPETCRHRRRRPRCNPHR